MDIKTRLTAGDMFWGLTPYVGVNVTAELDEGRVFQGTTTLLPYQGDSLALQGVAGIAYELMPGVGAGLEYRYQGYAAATPVAADASSNQTIMMRSGSGSELRPYNMGFVPDERGASSSGAARPLEHLRGCFGGRRLFRQSRSQRLCLPQLA